MRIMLKQGRPAILLSILIGTCGYGLTELLPVAYGDPLLLALVIGVITRTVIGDKWNLDKSLPIATVIFIPIGIVFYAMKNLNFATIVTFEKGSVFLLVAVVVVYFVSILVLGKIFGQREQITYLTATGSAICGASAIAIVSPTVEAEPDDVSISLVAVALVALLGLFTVLPFLGTLCNLTSRTYGLLAGSVLQFTGFVKAAVESVPYLTSDIPHNELVSLALSVKAVRYLGLLVAIPLFASLVKKKIFIPWQLGLFVGSGLCGTLIFYWNGGFYSDRLLPLISPLYNLSWSVALAAIGLNADVKQLLSNNGIKAIGMALGGFIAATTTFLLGLFILHLLAR